MFEYYKPSTQEKDYEKLVELTTELGEERIITTVLRNRLMIIDLQKQIQELKEELHKNSSK